MREKESTAQVERKKERRALFAPAFALRVLGPPHRFSNILPPPGRRLNKTKEKKIRRPKKERKSRCLPFKTFVGWNQQIYTRHLPFNCFFFCSHVAKISDRVKQSNSKVNGDQTNRTWTLYIRRNAQMCVWPSKKEKILVPFTSWLRRQSTANLRPFYDEFLHFSFSCLPFFQKRKKLPC